MHFQLWIFLAYGEIYVGLLCLWDAVPAMQMQLQVWMKVLHFYLCWPGLEVMAKLSLTDQSARTPPWYFSFEKVNLPNT